MSSFNLLPGNNYYV